MSVTVTERAQKQLKKILEKKGAENKSLRIYVAGVG